MANKIFLYYKCCNVCGTDTRLTPCWACGKKIGVPYFDIFPASTLGTYMQMSLVKEEFIKCRTP